jgi:hypothetical protein
LTVRAAEGCAFALMIAGEEASVASPPASTLRRVVAMADSLWFRARALSKD